MVPSVAKSGTSFKGAALYYLHDKREAWEAERMTSDRVAWTATRNMATDNPELAWRIMAATARDQDRLKAEAGVKKSGRKSDACVYAYSLAWHPDEKKMLSKAEMLRAADETLRVIGAQGHQAMFVCHGDEKHPHVHVIVNRVHPETGVMLTKSNDRLKLSQWSEAYERERGRIWCEQRVANNARRAQGEFFRASSPTPRSMEKDFDRARGSNENQARRARDEAKMRTAKLAADSAAMNKRHRTEWDVLSKGYKDRKDGAYAGARESGDRIARAIKEQFAPNWRDLYGRHYREQRAFKIREARLGGKIKNAIDAITHRRDLDPENSRGFVAAAFNFLTSKRARETALQKLHDQEKRALRREEKAQIDRAKQNVIVTRSGSLKAAKDRFALDRAALLARQADERQQMKARWREESEIRGRAFDTIGRAADLKTAARTGMDNDERREAERGRAEFQQASRTQGRGVRLRRTRKRTRKSDDSD